MMEARSVDVPMIDLVRVGGITQWLKVAGMAEAFNLPVVSHLIPEVHVHLIGAVPNGLTVEYMPWLVPLFKQVPEQQNGELAMPTAPGLGLEFDQATLDRYKASLAAAPTRGQRGAPFRQEYRERLDRRLCGRDRLHLRLLRGTEPAPAAGAFPQCRLAAAGNRHRLRTRLRPGRQHRDACRGLDGALVRHRFIPAHAAFARSLATAAGSDAKLFDQSFAEFCARSDLPQFDFIGLHGIYSWVSEENQTVIVDFVRRRLKVGGVLYISYNTQPGYAATAAAAASVTRHAESMGAAGRGTCKLEGALEFADKLMGVKPAFRDRQPAVAER